jgi:amino acid transporter
VRWLAVAAGMGASAIFFWTIGAIMLAIPMGFISAQLSRIYPEEGGIYAWTRRTLGEKNGFIVSWLYFINNIFYYPAVLIFLATNFAFFLGKPALANNSLFVCTTVIIFFWLVVFISLWGLKANKLMAEYGGTLGSIVPAALIILLGFFLLFWTGQSATHFAWNQILPTHAIGHSLANLTMLMFAMTGVEIIPTFANAVKNPKRDLYFGLIIGAFALIAFYAIGTVALNIILSPDDIHKTTGLMHAFQLVFARFDIPWMTRSIALMLVFAELAVVSIWLVAPITMFFKCTPKGLLPNWFHKTNRFDAPTNALLFVGLLVTIILLTTNLLPAVNDMYQVLVLMSVLLTFLPYIFLVAAYVKSRKKIPMRKSIQLFFVISVLISLFLGIIFSFQLPDNIKTVGDKLFYEAELILGPIIFVAVGYYLYDRWEKRA